MLPSSRCSRNTFRTPAAPHNRSACSDADGGQRCDSNRPAPAAASVPRHHQAGGSETETVIENDLYRITFTNRGAQVKSWILKKFDNDAENGPLDLVNAPAPRCMAIRSRSGLMMRVCAGS